MKKTTLENKRKDILHAIKRKADRENIPIQEIERQTEIGRGNFARQISGNPKLEIVIRLAAAVGYELTLNERKGRVPSKDLTKTQIPLTCTNCGEKFEYGYQLLHHTRKCQK